MTRDSFIFYRSFKNALSKLDDADRLAAYDALTEYGLDGILNAEGVAAAIVEAFRPLIEANNRKVLNGRKGGEANSKQNEASDKQTEANSKQNEAEPEQSEAKCKRRNVKGEILKDKDIKEGGAAFRRPTLEEVTAYCRERGNHVDPQAFIDFYSSKGW